MNSLLEHLALMLKMLHQPIKLRQVSGTDVLMLGPYRTLEMQTTSCWMAICSRRATSQALGSASETEPEPPDVLDFHLHFPNKIPQDIRQELSWLLLHINRLLPVGRFQLLPHGRLVYVHELSLHQNPPPGLIMELIARLLYGFFQAAPLIMSVTNYKLHPMQALARLRFDPFPKGGAYWLLTTQQVRAS